MQNNNDKNSLIPIIKNAELIEDRTPNELEEICNINHEHITPPENKQTIVVDWLTLSFIKLLPHISQILKMNRTNGQFDLNPDCYLVYVNSAINGFKHTAQIFLHGKLLVSCQFDIVA